jgi:hypothetical protein
MGHPTSANSPAPRSASESPPRDNLTPTCKLRHGREGGHIRHRTSDIRHGGRGHIRHPTSDMDGRGRSARKSPGLLRHTGGRSDRCFLPDLTRFERSCCTGPGLIPAESRDDHFRVRGGVDGGESGIRTHGTGLPYTRFPSVLLKPLGHLSGVPTRDAAPRRSRGSDQLAKDHGSQPAPAGFTQRSLRGELWRRGGDSNPRYRFRYNGFRDRRNQPLCHLSATRSSGGKRRYGVSNFRSRNDWKNRWSSSRERSSSNPSINSTRWFSRGSCTRFPSDPQKPPFGSRAP